MNHWIATLHRGSEPPVQIPLPAGEFFIGSDSDCRIPLPGSGLRKAALRLSELGAEIENLGAEVEIRVNGQPVRGTLRLELPARIMVEDAELELQMDQDSSPTEQIGEETVSENTLAWGLEEEEDSKIGDSVPVTSQYALREQIARGGMGRIFAAKDPLLNCEVAVKVCTAAQGEGYEQFMAEARILAQLAHPNIVPVHSMGINERGLPFYCMKLVRGHSLHAILKELKNGHARHAAHFTLEQLLTVFRKVCDAIEFAHSKRILHRDLKPQNIMVGEHGEVLVMDWGLALQIERQQPPQLLPDGSVSIEGTPQYMSPEQANALELDERSDVYALGAILYAILNFESPFSGASVDEVLSKVREGDMRPMNDRTVWVPGSEGRKIPSALKAVVRKAMAKHREARYRNVRALVQDLDSYQNGFATNAEEAGLGRHAMLLLRRHKIAALFSFLLLFSGVIFTVRLSQSERLATKNAAQAKLNEQLAKQSEERAIRSAQEAIENARLAAESAKEAIREREQARREKEQARRKEAKEQMALAEAAEQNLDAEEMFRALGAVPKDLQDREWRYLQGRIDTSDITLEAIAGSPWKDWTPHPLKPGVIVTLQEDGWVRTVDLATGSVENLTRLGGTSELNCGFCISPDATRVAIVRYKPSPPQQPQTARIDIVQVSSPNSHLLIETPWVAGGFELQFSPDGSLIASATRGKEGVFENELAVFDAKGAKLIWRRPMENPGVCSFAADGGALMLLDADDNLLELEPLTGNPRREARKLPVPHGGQTVEKFAHSNDWSRVFLIRQDKAYALEPDGGKVLECHLPVGARTLSRLAYLQHESILATVSLTGDKCSVLQLWDSHSGNLLRSALLRIPLKPTGMEWSLVAHPQSSQIAVIRGTTMKIWNRAAFYRETQRLSPLENKEGFSFLDKPWRVLLCSQHSSDAKPQPFYEAEVLDLRSATPQKQFSLTISPGAPPPLVSVSSDGRWLAMWTTGEVSSSDPKQPPANAQEQKPKNLPLKVFQTFDNGSLKLVYESGAIPLQGILQMNHNGGRLWCGDSVYDIQQKKLVCKPDRKGLIPLTDNATQRWVGNSKLAEIVMIDSNRTLVLWDANNGVRLRSADAHLANAISVSPNGSQIAEAGKDMRVRIRDASTLEEKRSMRVHEEALVDVAWHPKLPLLATSSEDHTVRIWNLENEELVEEFGLFKALHQRLRWSPDGTALAVVDAETGVSNLINPKCTAPKPPPAAPATAASSNTPKQPDPKQTPAPK